MKKILKSSVIALMLLAVLAGCQTQDVETATVVEAPSATPVAAADIPAVPAPAATPAPASVESAEEPAVSAAVEATYSYQGYELGIDAYSDYALISYPAIVTEADVEAFIAQLAAAFPELASQVSYSFDDETTLRLEYPAMDDNTRRSFVSLFAGAALEVGKELFPSDASYVASYSAAGYELTAEIGDEVATIYYPEAISSSDMESFLASENSKYAGSGILSGVYYDIAEEGKVVLSYPDSMLRSDVLLFSAIAVNDLVGYFL